MAVEGNLDISQRIVFAFISINPFFTKRIINEIHEQKIINKKIVLIANYSEGIDDVRCLLSQTGIPYLLITLNEIRSLLSSEIIPYYINKDCLNNGFVSDIATARSLLHLYSKQESQDGDIIWILDDDMEFAQNIMIDGRIIKQRLNISSIINQYINKYDVVVGSYSQDAPLPTLSILRTALLDYVYENKLSKNQIYDESIYKFRDYYYDLTSETHCHLETPVKLIESSRLEDILSGKAISRLLFSKSLSEFDVYSRGGNTLIFNREVLDIPNISLVLEDNVARRSDYFWVQQVKKKGYRIIGSTFSIFHHRERVVFDYDKEVGRQIQDLIGSSFTKANDEIVNLSKIGFYSLFKKYYQERLTRIIINYFRIIGLFEIIKSDKYLEFFNKNNLIDFIRVSKGYLEPSLVQSAFSDLYSKISIHQHCMYLSKYKEMVENAFSTRITKLLGMGEEGIVFSDGLYVYKITYIKLESEILQHFKRFYQCNALFPIKVKQLDGNTIIYYLYDENWQSYESGFAIQIAELIIFLKSKGLVLTNFKKQNFIVLNKQIKLIDYGRNIEIYTPYKYQQSIERAYQMLKYPNLSILEYKHMITRSYLEKDRVFLFGIEQFHKILDKRYKEQTHDQIVIGLVKYLNPGAILDYGAGKCKIANVLSQYMNVDVFDVNLEQLCRSEERREGRV